MGAIALTGAAITGVAESQRIERTASRFTEDFLSETALTELWWVQRLSLDRTTARRARGEEDRRQTDKNERPGTRTIRRANRFPAARHSRLGCFQRGGQRPGIARGKGPLRAGAF